MHTDPNAKASYITLAISICSKTLLSPVRVSYVMSMPRHHITPFTITMKTSLHLIYGSGQPSTFPLNVEPHTSYSPTTISEIQFHVVFAAFSIGTVLSLVLIVADNLFSSFPLILLTFPH